MTGPASLPPADEQKAPRGLLAELLSLTGSLGRHVQALAALAGTEAKEAAGVYLRVLILAMAGLILAAFGYVLLIFFVAFLLATVCGISWIWISLGLALLHLLGAAICFLVAKNHATSPQFTATSQELKRDFDSLQNFKP